MAIGYWLIFTPIRLETPDFRGWLDESGSTFQAPNSISEPESCDGEFWNHRLTQINTVKFTEEDAEKGNSLLRSRYDYRRALRWRQTCWQVWLAWHTTEG
jgi:hypothetical protein